MSVSHEICEQKDHSIEFHSRLLKEATKFCDREGNVARIIASIREAKARDATLRVGLELEITGYGCYDHFLESDIYLHSWEMISRILQDVSCWEILLDIGMLVMVRHDLIEFNLASLRHLTGLMQKIASQCSLQLSCYYLLQRRYTSYTPEIVLGRARRLPVRKSNLHSKLSSLRIGFSTARKRNSILNHCDAELSWNFGELEVEGVLAFP